MRQVPIEKLFELIDLRQPSRYQLPLELWSEAWERFSAAEAVAPHSYSFQQIGASIGAMIPEPEEDVPRILRQMPASRRA